MAMMKKMAMAKAMKAMKTMKAMKMKKSMAKKAMKAMKKRVMKKSAKSYKSTSGARRAVMAGTIMKSKGGLKKEAFTKNKNGKIVSKKASANGKKIYNKYLAKWNKAVQAARKALKVQGFQAVGGKSAKGQALLKKARSLYKK